MGLVQAALPSDVNDASHELSRPSAGRAAQPHLDGGKNVVKRSDQESWCTYYHWDLLEMYFTFRRPFFEVYAMKFLSRVAEASFGQT